jgi:hypothetical protein
MASITHGTHGPDTCTCNICMNTIDIESGTYFTTECNHIFHNKCLMQWIITNNTCPTCRQDIYENRSTVNSNKFVIKYLESKTQILPNDYDKITDRATDIIYVIDNNNDNNDTDNLIIPTNDLKYKWHIYDIDTNTIVVKNTIYTKNHNILIEFMVHKKKNDYFIEIELKYINKQPFKKKLFKTQFKQLKIPKNNVNRNRKCRL